MAASFDAVVISADPAEGSLAGEKTIPKTDTPNNSYTVTGLTAGVEYTIKIKARYSGGKLSGETAKTVAAVSTVTVTEISLDYTSLALTTTNPPQQLTPAITPPNANNQAIIWTSANTAVATVNGSGQVTAVSQGTAIITAITEDGGKTASCLATVSPSPAGSLAS
jgi:transglutaminase/protease-like cytokinesis protein 3